VKLSDLNIPPEHDHTDQHCADIQRAWEIIRLSVPRQTRIGQAVPLDSTEGHLAVLRAILLGRQLERERINAAH